MSKVNNFGVLLASSFLVSACSTADFAAEDAVARGIEIANGIFDETITEMNPEDLPEGVAVLNGAMALVTESSLPGPLAAAVEQDVAVGDLTLTANFDASTIVGEATDFGLYNIVFDDEALTLTSMELDHLFDGSLDVDGDIAGSGFLADLTGTLEDNTGVDQGTYDVDALMTGAFFDDDGSLLAAGFVEGGVIATPILGDFDEGPDGLFGAFYAEEGGNLN